MAPAPRDRVALQPKAGPAAAGAFYPESCHPLLSTRRRFLAGVTAFAAGSALGARSARAGDDGTAMIRKWAVVGDDPWAVCHAIRAMGRDLRLKDGRHAVDWLLETQLAQVPANTGSVLGFALQTEVHPNSFLKTLLEAGVPLDYTFTHHRRPRTLNDVVDGARALFRPAQVIGQPNMLPWSIIAFSRTTSPLRPRWTNAWGESVDLDVVVESALRQMEEASLPLAKAMREDRPETGMAPVHGFTCGGTHMLYALLTAVAAGHAGRDRAHRVKQQTDLMVWRLHADLDVIERFYRERAAQAGAYWYELDAKVKLLGHGEECLALGTRRNVVKLSESQQRQRRAAVTALKRMIEDMEGRNLGEARDLDRELFRQIVGDTCHARHGLTFA